MSDFFLDTSALVKRFSRMKRFLVPVCRLFYSLAVNIAIHLAKNGSSKR